MLPVLEVGIILAVGVLFVRPYLDFDGSVAVAGREFEGNSAWIDAARRSILDFGELPLGSHWLDTGIPYLADPMSTGCRADDFSSGLAQSYLA